MLSEVVRKHLLKDRKTPLNDDDLEIAVHVGWTARNDEIDKLKAENARYREALEFYADEKNWIMRDDVQDVCVTDWSKKEKHSIPVAGKRAREALKGGK